MSHETDEALLLRIGQGDQAAFAALVARYRPKAVSTAWRVCGNQADGEEVAQEAFARVWVNAAKWRAAEEGGTAKFSTWLYRVVVNLCIDRKRRPQASPLEDAPEMADESPDATALIERRQVAEAVAKAVAALPERQKTALVLCVYEGVSNGDAASIMGLSVGAVESLLVRARRTLRESLAAVHAELQET